MRNKILF